MSFKPGELDWLEELDDAGRVPFEDPAALDELRRNAFETIGPAWGAGLLYGVGFAQGLIDGLRVTRGFGSSLLASPGTSTPLGLLFAADGGEPDGRITGVLRDSLEARLHVAGYPPSEGAVCFVSAGYAAGWYSGLLDSFYLARENACMACGDAACRFTVRPARAWLEAGDPWARELVAYVDWEELHRAALLRLEEESGPEDDADGLMGHFDPLSPAVHVWGPVMILPYSGAEDTETAVDAIQTDLGPGSVAVAVIDLTGVQLQGVEATGLVRLLDALEERDIEPLVVGLKGAARAALKSGRQNLSLPLIVDELEAAVALAFQLCHQRQS
jgi:hypothetical protein